MFSKSVPDIRELEDLLSSVLDSAGAGTMLSRDSSLLLFCSETECLCCRLSDSLIADSGMDPPAPRLDGASLALLDVRLSIRLRSVDGGCWDSPLLPVVTGGTLWLSVLTGVGSTTDSVEIGGSSTGGTEL